MHLAVSSASTVCSTRNPFSYTRPRLAVMNCCDHRSTVDSRFAIRLARTTGELRAAAYLRAVAFYKYAADRSEYAARAHQRMKADSEWAALEAKTASKDPLYQGIIVQCYISTASADVDMFTLAPHTNTNASELSAQLPASDSTGPERIVGTLDLNQGLKLPSEELVGKLPVNGDGHQRAYLSNVCTAQAAQRQGVACALVEAAAKAAVAEGIQHLYVHVAHSNVAAKQLYIDRCGFKEEQHESEGYARALSRPRRLLLHLALTV